MKLIIYTSIFLIVSNFTFADVKINKCDNIKDNRQKTSCLKKLKLQAIKENSKKKVNIIQDKLKKTHKKIGKGLKKTEKGAAKEAAKLAKKVGDRKKNR